MLGVGKVYKIGVQDFKPFATILESVETKIGCSISDYTFIRQDTGKRCYVSMVNDIFYVNLGFRNVYLVKVEEDYDSTRLILVKAFPINQPS